jgi:hypothetical protein
MYAHKIKSPENASNESEKEAALFSLRNLLKTLKFTSDTQDTNQNTTPFKFAKDILTYVDIPHSSCPVSAGQDHVTPSKPAMNNTEESQQESLQGDNQNNQIDPMRVTSENAEIAPILHKLGQAWRNAQENLCRTDTHVGIGGVLEFSKGATVVRLGTKVLQGLENSGALIPAPLQASSGNLTTGINFERLSQNIASIKQQQLYGQNPLPLGHTANSAASSPTATYPGMASGSPQNSPANSPGATNPMLAGSNASTSPISHMGGLKSKDNVPLGGAKALMGNGNAGFTGAANMHGNEKLPNMTEFASDKLGIPRFQ